MKTKLFFLFLMITAIIRTNAQQNYFIYANGYNTDTIQVCYGNEVMLLAGGGAGNTLFYDNFNAGVLSSSLWTSNNTYPVFNNPCGPGSDGSICAWMGDASCFPRELVTVPLSVTGQIQICFDMRYATQGNPSPCEGPDLPNEGVHLQYSTDGGNNWTDINYWDPNGGYDPLMTNWNFYCEYFNYIGTIQFRWFQEGTSGNGYDNWGIDNVSITGASNSNAEWTGSNGFYSTDNPVSFNAVSSEMYHLIVTDTSGTYVDSIYVDVVGSPILFSGLNSVYCSSADSVLITVNPTGTQISGNGISGNYFYPSQVNGNDTIWFSLPSAYSFSSISTIIAWEDNFSQDLGWTGDIAVWQRDAVSAPANSCPAYDYTQSNTDNYIMGTNVNDYYTTNLSTTSWMMSPSINLTGKTNCKLQFYSASSFEPNDTAKIMVYDGTVWNELSFNEPNTSSWQLIEYDISAYADNNPDFKIMFGIGPTGATVNECGWNIDDIVIIADSTVQNTGTCSTDTFFAVDVPTSAPAPEICMVTNDTTNHHNMIIWDNVTGNNPQMYYIYRETTTPGVFDILDSVMPSDNYYIDSSSIPNQQSYKYKLAFLDTCGNLSIQSQYHRTIHLDISPVSPQGFNLIWEPYEGFSFSSYIIYRGTNQGQMLPLSSVSSGTTIFTDLNPPVGYVYYMIVAQKPDSCEIQQGQYISQSLSNVVQENNTGIHTQLDENTLTILPNPNNGQVQLQMTNNFSGKFQVTVFDNLGRKVFIKEFTKTAVRFSQNIDLSVLSEGIYQVQVNLNGNRIIQKMVIQK